MERNYYVKWNMYILLIVMCVIVNKYVIWEDWKKIYRGMCNNRKIEFLKIKFFLGILCIFNDIIYNDC